MYYRARYYAQGLGRFISADTMVPDSSNPPSLNRFSYTRNNPLKYIDPTGHRETDGCDYEGCDGLRGSVYQRDGAAAPAEKFYRDCANGGGANCNSLYDVENILKGAGIVFVGLVAAPFVAEIAAGASSAWATGGARAAAACANNPACTTLLLGAGTKAARPTVEPVTERPLVWGESKVARNGQE
jgi:hypothetical protein